MIVYYRKIETIEEGELCKRYRRLVSPDNKYPSGGYIQTGPAFKYLYELKDHYNNILFEPKFKAI